MTLRLSLSKATHDQLRKVDVCFRPSLPLRFVPWTWEAKKTSNTIVPNHRYYWLTDKQINGLNEGGKTDVTFVLAGGWKGEEDIVIVDLLSGHQRELALIRLRVGL
jgi:hypothetical protein